MRDRKSSPQKRWPKLVASTVQLLLAGLTSASLEGLWLTSALLSGANCCTRLRLLVSARVSLANFVDPAGDTTVDATTKTLNTNTRQKLK